MIQTFCRCGGPVRAAESADAAACGGCGRTVYLAAAEPLADGMGGGDFDARLVVEAGPGGIGDTIALGGVPDLEVGKAEQRHVRLDGTRVSRAHARLIRLDFGPSRWKVVDTASRNGTFVNGQRVAEAELADGDLVGVGEYRLRYVVAPLPAAVKGLTTDVRCPSCDGMYGPGTTICVACGIHIATGRPLVVSRGLDEDALAERSHTWIRIVSWIVPFGLYPIASEAFGTRRPRAIWWVTGVTVAASLMFFVPYYGNWSAGTRPWEMWCGSGPMVIRFHGQPIVVPAEMLGQFHPYQLITSALIHAGIMHLAGNLVFLLVFGIRVNELLGDLRTAVLYPVLAVAAGLTFVLATMAEPTHAYLGASGAIMGLAGMYVVFFPVQKVVMAIWFRGWLLTGFRCLYKVFRVRGVWLLMLWVGLNDALPTLLAAARGGAVHDGTAHWAHLGGFLTGMAVAVGLLVTRQANAHGSDLLSVLLGRRAWVLLGKPATRGM